jgi:hypothetical protein
MRLLNRQFQEGQLEPQLAGTQLDSYFPQAGYTEKEGIALILYEVVNAIAQLRMIACGP